jgi:hypothetical protein
LHSDRTYASNQLLYNIQQDTLSADTDSLRHCLTLQDHFFFEQQIIDSYLQENDFASAQSEINNYDFGSSGLPRNLRADAQEFESLKQWMLNILQIPGEIANLSAADLDFLRTMAEGGKGTASYQARNILCFFTFGRHLTFAAG